MAAAQGSEHTRFTAMSSGRYLNVVLTAIAIALGVIALKQTVGPQAAHAANPRTTRSAVVAEEGAPGLPNAAEQRIRMIESLRSIDSRLQAIESRLKSGPIEVRVVELPASFGKEE